MRPLVQTGHTDSGVVRTRPRGHTRVRRDGFCQGVRGPRGGVVRDETLRERGRRWGKDPYAPIGARPSPS